MMTKPRTIVLFYDGFELKADEGLAGKALSQARRAARYAYRSARRLQVHTGFYTAFLGLKASLKAAGVHVRVNDFAYARRHPKAPVGVAGFPSVLAKIRLSNPLIFGPGDYGSGADAIKLASDPRFKVLSQPGEWAVELYRQWVGAKGHAFFAGIDTDKWPDLSKANKTIDFLVYDKIRWHRDSRQKTVMDRCLSALQSKRLSYRVVRYGHHHISEFRDGLKDARALLFICEHETQGLAYQEALSSNVPVLAWDEGEPVDPHILAVAPAGLRVSSVPYFDERCGLTFRIDEVEETLAAFLNALPTFSPREYVLQELSLEKSGARYLELYEMARHSVAKPHDTQAKSSTTD